MDLVEVAPQISPPVARIVDFEKFRYHEEKKEQAARKRAREVEIKEVWLSPRIAEHDLLVRLRKAEVFLTEGNKVKLTVKFRGREMAHPENGYAIVTKALRYFGERIQVERETKFEGRNLTTIIGLAKAKPKEDLKDEGQDENENQEVTAQKS